VVKDAAFKNFVRRIGAVPRTAAPAKRGSANSSKKRSRLVTAEK
jgi:hypothetical protein